MKTLSNVEVPLSQMFASWMTHQISRTAAAIRPAHRASDIAIAVAASGNPTGA